MKCKTIERGNGTASVLVTPSWLRRLFGARPYVIRCKRDSFGWCTEMTGRRVSYAVLDALDRDGVPSLAEARTVR